MTASDVQAFVAVAFKDPLDGGWIAMASAFPGCFSQGESPDEVLRNLADAVAGVIGFQAEMHGEAGR
jgi:predicted RNase H-like HicB family nuclease